MHRYHWFGTSRSETSPFTSDGDVVKVCRYKRLTVTCRIEALSSKATIPPLPSTLGKTTVRLTSLLPSIRASLPSALGPAVSTWGHRHSPQQGEQRRCRCCHSPQLEEKWQRWYRTPLNVGNSTARWKPGLFVAFRRGSPVGRTTYLLILLRMPPE